MKKFTLFFFLIVVLVPGCVEHFILINVQPGGGYTLEFISRGDSTDVFNDDFSHPTAGKRWTQHVGLKNLRTIQPGSWKPGDILNWEINLFHHMMP